MRKEEEEEEQEGCEQLSAALAMPGHLDYSFQHALAGLLLRCTPGLPAEHHPWSFPAKLPKIEEEEEEESSVPPAGGAQLSALR